MPLMQKNCEYILENSQLVIFDGILVQFTEGRWKGDMHCPRIGSFWKLLSDLALAKIAKKRPKSQMNNIQDLAIFVKSHI